MADKKTDLSTTLILENSKIESSHFKDITAGSIALEKRNDVSHLEMVYENSHNYSPGRVV